MWWNYMYSYRFQYQIFINTYTYSRAQSSPSLKYITDLYCEILVPRHQTKTIFIVVLSKHQNNKYELDMCYWLDNSWNYQKCSNTLTDEYLKQCKLRPQSNDHIYISQMIVHVGCSLRLCCYSSSSVTSLLWQLAS